MRFMRHLGLVEHELEGGKRILRAGSIIEYIVTIKSINKSMTVLQEELDQSCKKVTTHSYIMHVQVNM